MKVPQDSQPPDRVFVTGEFDDLCEFPPAAGDAVVLEPRECPLDADLALGMTL